MSTPEEIKEQEEAQRVHAFNEYVNDVQSEDVGSMFERIRRDNEKNPLYSFSGYTESPKRNGEEYLLISLIVDSKDKNKDTLVVFTTRCINGKHSFETYKFTPKLSLVHVGETSLPTVTINYTNGNSDILTFVMRNDRFIFTFNEDVMLPIFKAAATMSALFFSKKETSARGIGNLVTCLPSNYKLVGFGQDEVSRAIWGNCIGQVLIGQVFYCDFSLEVLRYRDMNNNNIELLFAMIWNYINKDELLDYICGIENICAMLKGSGGFYNVKCLYGTVTEFRRNGNLTRGIEWTVILSANNYERIIPHNFRDDLYKV